MRKWMRERLQRRKKKTTEEASQPAPPPLQPAYFEGDGPEDGPEFVQPEAETPKAREPKVREPEVEVQPVEDEVVAAGDSEPPQRSEPAGDAQRRGRRRRGGRGGSSGGGRGRERAVAQAFTPAAAKGIIPELPTEEPEEPVEEAPEPETVGEAESAAEAAFPAEATAEAEPAAPAPEAAAIPAAVPAAPTRPPKGIVVLAIGLPGSGKSSWFKRHNLLPLSSDMMRSLLFDDIREQRFQDLVFSNLRSMLKARLIAKRPMNYVDATNLTPQERHHWIKLAKDYNYEVHAVFFDVPLETCIERHNRRDRVVPEEIMRRMAAKLKAPTFQEGFAKITVVRVKRKEGVAAS
jgi:predicted kinase